jgi:hypothetical protein
VIGYAGIQVRGTKTAIADLCVGKIDQMSTSTIHPQSKDLLDVAQSIRPQAKELLDVVQTIASEWCGRAL